MSRKTHQVQVFRDTGQLSVSLPDAVYHRLRRVLSLEVLLGPRVGSLFYVYNNIKYIHWYSLQCLYA